MIISRRKSSGGMSTYRRAEIDMGAWESLMHCWCPACCHETNECCIKNRVHCASYLLMYMEAYIRRLELNALIFFFFQHFCIRIRCLNAARIHSSKSQSVWWSAVVRGSTYSDHVECSFSNEAAIELGSQHQSAEATLQSHRSGAIFSGAPALVWPVGEFWWAIRNHYKRKT